MRIALDTSLSKLPLAATPTWPDGVWDLEAFARGSISVILFTPRGRDDQTTHGRRRAARDHLIRS